MFFYFSFPQSLPEVPRIEMPQAPANTTQAANFATYADADYSKKEVNFSCGQTVFVRYQLAIDYGGKATFTLLDSGKKQLSSFQLSPKERVYQGSFSAPDSSGTYYVHFEIKDQGLAVSVEQNINVQCQGETKGVVESKTVTEAFVESSEQIGYSPIPESCPLSSSTPAAEIQPVPLLITKIKAYILKIFRLFGLF